MLCPERRRGRACRAPRMPGAAGRDRPLERPSRARPTEPRAPGERGGHPPGSRSAGAVQVGRETGTGNAAGPEPLSLAGSPHCERGRETEGKVHCAGWRTGLLERKGEFYNARAPSPSSRPWEGRTKRVCAEAARSVERLPHRGEESSQLPAQPLFISNCGRRSSFSQISN